MARRTRKKSPSPETLVDSDEDFAAVASDDQYASLLIFLSWPANFSPVIFYRVGGNDTENDNESKSRQDNKGNNTRLRRSEVSAEKDRAQTPELENDDDM